MCDPETAAERFLSRDRHPAHGDHRKSPIGILKQFRALHRLGPLGFAPVVTVDTEVPIDSAKLVLRIQQTA